MDEGRLDLPIDLVLGWLDRNGFRVERRCLVWHECWIRGAGESWLGRGETAGAAFRDALRSAFPTAIAWGAFRSVIEAELARIPPQAATGSTAEAAEPDPVRTEPFVPVAAGVPAVVEAPAMDVREEPPAPALQRPVRRLPPMDPVEAEEALGDLSDTIDKTRGEVAMWSDERQRLQILIWISAARALEAAAGSALKPLVGNVARQLSLLTARWWPGSVSALQQAAYPAECARSFALPEAWSWFELWEAAEEGLSELENSQEAEGADEDGWFDGVALKPVHPDPVSAWREARAILEESTGPFGTKPDRFAPRRADAGIATQELERLAKSLRWIRRSVDDAAAWGDAIGRLRWLARTGCDALIRWLDPRYSPRQNWAAELGWDPDKRSRKHRRAMVLRDSPAPFQPIDEEKLASWLRQAFECGQELDNLRIASVIQSHAARVLTLKEDSFSGERAQRSRLKKLKGVLRGGGSEFPTREQVLNEAITESSDDILPAEVPDPSQSMLEEILPFTRDKNALVVSNRVDGHQDDSLRATFGFATLDHEVAEPRRLAAVTERIRSRKYHLVLSATGFQSHASDRQLKRAADQVGIPYVRADKARRLACIRALHRELRSSSAAASPA